MSTNILDSIVEQRKKDIAKFGFTLGFDIPATRARGEVVPFIAEKGTILEVKRASPSKGDIAPALNAADTAVHYAKAGTAAISVLTEQHWFKGSLDDLIAVGKAVDKYAEETKSRRVAVLRKDFLLEPEEVDIAYRCGADAVLLIARILTKEKLAEMAKKCEQYGMTAFVELRLKEDLDKVAFAVKTVSAKYIVCGVNARDLRTFTIDLLTPLALLTDIRAILGENGRVVFESGIRTPEAAAFAGSLGFSGMLLGEAAAKNPAAAGKLVAAFVNAKPDLNAGQWLSHALRLHKRHETGNTKPLVKICGITNQEDAQLAASLGADFLGFIFCSKSPRCTTEKTVRTVAANVKKARYPGVTLVGVITETDSQEGKAALALAREGILDFLQLHGKACIEQFFKSPDLQNLPHYCAVNIAEESDIAFLEELRKRGEPRFLIDAKVQDTLGGTGVCISSPLVEEVRKKNVLWLAGGVTPDNVSQLAETFCPELIDTASGVESSPGKKDSEKLKKLFKAVQSL